MLADYKTTPIGRMTMVTLGGVKASLSIVRALHTLTKSKTVVYGYCNLAFRKPTDVIG